VSCTILLLLRCRGTFVPSPLRIFQPIWLQAAGHNWLGVNELRCEGFATDAKVGTHAVYLSLGFGAKTPDQPLQELGTLLLIDFGSG
jgi:hypothetical protein